MKLLSLPFSSSDQVISGVTERKLRTGQKRERLYLASGVEIEGAEQRQVAALSNSWRVFFGGFFVEV